MNRTKAVRNMLLSLSLAASAFAAPAYAQISFNIVVAPPAPQYEVVPVIPHGNVWAPGYWGWSGERYVWVRGRPIMQREGYQWAPDRWEARDNHYYRTAGHWEPAYSQHPVKMKEDKKQKHNNGGNGHGKGHQGNGHDGKHGKGDKHRG